MKKLFYLLIGLILLPSIAKADMFGPNVIAYTAVVNNPDGVDIYVCDEIESDEPAEEVSCAKSDEKVPYGTTYTIIDDNAICLNDDCTKFIYPKDLVAVDNNFKIDSKNLGEKFEATILVDMEIKKGPAIAYEGTGTIIKAGTSITATEVLFEEVQTPWFYVEYNGVKGFIDSYYEQIAFNIKDSIIIPMESKISGIYDFNTYDRVTNLTTDPIKNLEVGKKYNVKIGTFSLWSKYFYVELDGIKGKIPNFWFAIKCEPTTYKPVEDVNVYDASYEKVISKIEKGTTIVTEYCYDDTECYYEKDGIKGWIDTEEIKEETKEKTDNENLPIHETHEPNKEVKVNKPKKDYTLYICIGAGVILSITAVVTIILINKKKKNKEN